MFLSPAYADDVSNRQDSVGPMGKSSWDVAALLTCMQERGADLMSSIKVTRKWSLGVVGHPFEPINDSAVSMFEWALAVLQPLISVNQVKLPGVEKLYVNHGRYGWENGVWSGTAGDLLLAVEAKEALNNHLKKIADCAIRTVEHLIAWNEEHPVS